MGNPILEIIEEIKSAGFDVFGPELLTSYVYFTDGTRIGYAQYDRLSGKTYSTVHKPNRQTGTGFRADNMDEALSFIPHWAWASQRCYVVKHANFDKFAKNHWQPLVKY